MKANPDTITKSKQNLSEDIKKSLKEITVIIDKEAELFRRQKQYSSALKNLGDNIGKRDLAESEIKPIQSGWQCPGCKNIYSPFVESCKTCCKSS